MKKDIGYLVKAIDICLHKEANRDLEPLGLTLSQVQVLLLLREREKQRQMTSYMDIEENLGISQPTAGGLLRRLEAKGFIRTEVSITDRRIKNVFLANIDPAIWETIYANGKKAEKRILAGFSKDEVDTLRLALERILANIP